MMTDLEYIADKVRPIAQKYGVEKVSLFGSRARNDASEASDYDFVISKGNVDTLFKLAAFAEELENALGTAVDVVTDTSDDTDFLKRIMKEAIVVYERDR